MNVINQYNFKINIGCRSDIKLVKFIYSEKATKFCEIFPLLFSSVFRILILQVPSVNRIFPLRLLTAGAISLFLNITGAIAPVAPVLNTPLLLSYVVPVKSKGKISQNFAAFSEYMNFKMPSDKF